MNTYAKPMPPSQFKVSPKVVRDPARALAAVALATAALCSAAPSLAQVAAAPAGASAGASALVPTHQSRYDFSYQSSDPRVLVFDDGENTRIQLPPGVLLPTVIGQTNQGEAVLALQVQSPYLLTNGLFQRLTLRWANGQQVQIQYQGRTAVANRNGQAVAYGPTAPQAIYAPVPRPVEIAQAPAPGRYVQASMQTSMVTAPAPGASSLASVGRGAPSFAGSTPAAAPAPADALSNAKSLLSNEQFFFDFQVADQTISGTLRRWAAALGYELVWELPAELDPRIAHAQTWNKPLTFKQAIEQVARRMQARGYQVGVHIYTDGVIRFSVDADSSKTNV